MGRTTVKDEVKSPATSRIPGGGGVDEDAQGPANYTRNVELRPTLPITRRSRSSSPTPLGGKRKCGESADRHQYLNTNGDSVLLKLSTS